MRYLLVFVAAIGLNCASGSKSARQSPQPEAPPAETIVDGAWRAEDQVVYYMVGSEHFSGVVEARLPYNAMWEWSMEEKSESEALVMRNAFTGSRIAIQPYPVEDQRSADSRLSDLVPMLGRTAEAVGTVTTNRTGNVAFLPYADAEDDVIFEKRLAVVTFEDAPNLFVSLEGEWLPEYADEGRQAFDDVVVNISVTQR